MRSAVKSVREGGKGLQSRGKSAYREILKQTTSKQMKNSASNLEAMHIEDSDIGLSSSASAPSSPSDRKANRKLSITSSGNLKLDLVFLVNVTSGFQSLHPVPIRDFIVKGEFQSKQISDVQNDFVVDFDFEAV